MTDLERHILNLLLDNDCVIIPGFGGFIAHYVPAAYDESNSVFLPPMRIVGFNPRLTMNDSLLAQAYVNCYDISYPEALKHIEHDVDILKNIIAQEKTHEICGIGSIVVSNDGVYDFIPNNSSVVSPYIYGFEALEIEPLQQEATGTAAENDEKLHEEHNQPTQPVFTTAVFSTGDKAEPVPHSTNTATDEEPVYGERHLTVNIPIRTIRHIAAACAILFVLILFPSRLGDASKLSMNQSAIDTSWLYCIMPKDITSGKPDSLNNVVSGNASIASDGNGTIEKGLGKEEKPQDIREPQGKYFSIVLASRITKSNASLYVEKLHGKGLTESKVFSQNGHTKVLYRQYATLKAAYKDLLLLKEKPEFADSWVTEINGSADRI